MESLNGKSSGAVEASRFWPGILGLCVLILLISGLCELLSSMKMHFHLAVGREKNGKTRYLNICRNLSSVDYFTHAQTHDLKGETELANLDYISCVREPSFKKLSEKVKPVLMELVECRELMDKKDYFAELVTHSHISYWSQSQMPLKVYVPDQSKTDGFASFDRNEIKRCFDQWCAIVPDRVSYKFVSSPQGADIVFTQKGRAVDLSYSRTVLAHTIPIPAGREDWAVFPSSKATIEPLRLFPDIKNHKDKRAELRHTVLLHEIGHSLGIIGHSSNASDIMFFSGAKDLSERDKETFRRIYGPGSVHRRAEEAMRALAARNDKYALFQLALQFEENGTASVQKQKQVFKLAKKAADLGMPRAVYMLGWMYHDGSGVKRDLKEAVRCFHEASEKGNAASLLALAAAYERGDGEPQDLIAAEKYLKLALRMDLARAPIAYGNFLSYEYGDKDSLERAAQFYKQHSTRDQADAIIKLALAYEHGEGVKKNQAEAKKLRKQACDLVSRLKANDAPEFYARGCCWNDIGEPEKAIADLSAAIRLKPQCVSCYLGRGSAEQSCGRNNDACADMSKALELDPDSVRAYLGRAYAYLGMGDAEACLKDVNSILERTTSPDSDRTYALIVGSVAHRLLKQESQAKSMIDEAYKLTTRTSWPGPIVRYLRHDLSEEEFLKEAMGYSRSTEVYFYSAMEQANQGQNNSAIESLRWVKENGDRSFYEYPAAIAQLERLEKNNFQGARKHSI